MLKKLLVLILCVSSVSAQTNVIPAGSEVEVEPNVFKRFPLAIYSMDVNYVSGGLTVNFPAGLFSSTPVVYASVLPNVAYDSSVIFSAQVISVSTSQVTIRVNGGSVGGGISEVGTGDVMVNVLAIGQ